MKPFLYAFITLLLTGCVIYKKQATPAVQKIVDINKLPFTSSEPKCIVLKCLQPTVGHAYIYYYYFFPEYNIFMSDAKSGLPTKPQIGYYDFKAGDSLIYTEIATRKEDFQVLNKSIKKSTDSVYFHFNVASFKGLPFTKEDPITTHDSLPVTVTILKNSTDSCEFIVAIKKQKNLKSVYLYPMYAWFAIEENYNYYEIGGEVCFILSRNKMPFSFSNRANFKDTLKIKQISNDSFDINSYRNNNKQAIYVYTLEDLSSLKPDEKEKIYMLPTFIKILECSGTYPRK